MRERLTEQQSQRAFEALRALSFFHSAVYALLLWAWIAPGHLGLTNVLGWMHGLLWIGMSLACIVATRLRIIPFWLAVTVAVIGGIGPFAGTVGFVVESRRRREAGTAQTAGSVAAFEG